MRWWLVGAWALAAAACGVVLWPDAHFVIRIEERESRSNEISMLFGCFAMRLEFLERTPEPESVRDPPSGERVEARVYKYSEVEDGVPEDPADLERWRGVIVPISRAGPALFGIALGAVALGLLAVVFRGAPPSLRYAALFVAALAPLAALEYLGYLVHATRSEMAWADDPSGNHLASVFATGTTWAARSAWAGLAVASAIAWWRLPKRRKVKPVDPGVFE